MFCKIYFCDFSRVISINFHLARAVKFNTLEAKIVLLHRGTIYFLTKRSFFCFLKFVSALYFLVKHVTFQSLTKIEVTYRAQICIFILFKVLMEPLQFQGMKYDIVEVYIGCKSLPDEFLM